MTTNEMSFICDYKKCSKYLHYPVSLPCGYTICFKHINGKNNFKCLFCKTQHKSINDSGFCINQKLHNLIENNYHLNDNKEHKDAKVLCDKLKSTIRNFRMSNLDEPDIFIDNYFDKKREEINLSRKDLIENIDVKTCQLLDELKVFENKFKENINKVDKLEISNYILERYDLDKTLRDPYLNSSKLAQIKCHLNEQTLDLERKMKSYENDLKMNKEIVFFKAYPNSCGFLYAKDDLDLFNKPSNQLSIQLLSKLSNPFCFANLFSSSNPFLNNFKSDLKLVKADAQKLNKSIIFQK